MPYESRTPDHTRQWVGAVKPELPHNGVYTRLGVSKIHGIGVFAIRPIPSGTNVFSNDQVDLVWIERSALNHASLGPQELQLYHDFGIARGALIGCPVNFHNLTPGWYCNEPPEGSLPNMKVDADLEFWSIADIEEGEELTVQYDEFSKYPEEDV
jgi:hypothetical protein